MIGVGLGLGGFMAFLAVMAWLGPVISALLVMAIGTLIVGIVRALVWLIGRLSC